MRSPEERIASLEAFHTAHGEQHNAFERTLNLRFDDLKERLDNIDKQLRSRLSSNPGNGWLQKEVVVKIVFPSAGIGAGVVSLLYWVMQVVGK